MKAVIMAGGHGTRLRPLTSNMPKPMIPIVGIPCMEHIIELLRRHSITDIVVTLAFMPEEIRGYFGDGSDWGVDIKYSVEEVPAGTAGSIGLASEHLEGEPFVVISGDALTDIDLTDLIHFHRDRGATASMVLKSVESPLDFGIVITEEDGRIVRFLEKPAWGQVFSDTINTGIYLLEPEVLERIPKNPEGEYDFSKDLFPALLEEGAPLYGYITDGYWEDVGTLEQYASAQRDVLEGKVEGVRPPGTRLKENIYVGDRSKVDEDQLEGPVVIGENVRIDEGVYLSPYSVVGDNVVLAAGASVEQSIVLEGSYVGEGAGIFGTLVGHNCYVQARAQLLERGALGDDVIVGEGATISPDVKVYPHKTIESGAHVGQSMIYETMGMRTLFTGGAVSGKFNVDVTPEFLIRLFSSFGTTLAPGSIVTLGRDASLSAQAAKRAMTGALMSTGVSVRDLRAAHTGVVRHDVRAGKSSAGAHVRAGREPDEIEVLFFSSDATPMNESGQRSVEKVFVREEYRRAFLGDIGELIYPGRVVEQYVERLERAIDREATSGATIVVDFSNGVADLVASRVFSRLGIDAVVLSGFSNANVSGVTTSALGNQLEDSLQRVGNIVPTVGAAFGCVVSPSGEEVHFVDDRGDYVPPDVMLACFLSIMRPGKAVLPVNLSGRYHELVEKAGGEVVEGRTGIGNVSLKSAIEAADIAALDDGHYIFPDFLPAPDCFVSIGRALELFGEEALSGLHGSFGEHIGNVVVRPLDCPWSAKGRVMRGLAERFGGDPDAIMTDGVKLSLNSKGWVLMLPDPNNPRFYVYAEIDGEGERELEEYSELVNSLIKDSG